MQRARKMGAIMLIAMLAAAAILPAGAGAAVIQNTDTGQELEGTLTEQSINGLRVFVRDDGKRMFIDMDKWKVTESDPAEPVKEAETDGEAATAEQEETAKPTHVYMLPISGPIEHRSLVPAVERALGEARDLKCKVVVFRMNTPGGMVFVADEIIKLVETVKWAKTVAWVHGDENRALSAGAYISLSTHEIYMSPSTTIGAATPYTHDTSTGSTEVDAKFQSAFRARFRALAERRGHPKALVDAMVDSSVEAVQVFIDDQPRVVTGEEIAQLEKDHGDKFRRGKTISKAGKIVTLTADEAVEYGLAAKLAGSEPALMEALGIENYTLHKADWLQEWVVKDSEEKKSKFLKIKVVYETSWREAQRSDPNRQSYMIKENGNFNSASRRKWQQATDTCLQHLKNCHAALRELGKMIDAGECPVNISTDWVQEAKMELDAYYRRIGSERNRQGP